MPAPDNIVESKPGLDPTASSATTNSDGTPNLNKDTESLNESGDPQAFTGDGEQVIDAEGNRRIEDGDLTRYESNYESARTMSRRLTGTEKLIENAKDSDGPLPVMGDGKPYPPPLPDREPYAVAFDMPNDPEHPFNYPMWRKVLYTTIAGYTALVLTIGSAIFSQALEDLVKTYHIGKTTATLGTSLFVLGFGGGPIIYGPLSELFGRQPMLLISVFGYMLFTFAVATAKDIQTILICRFFAGFVGSAPLVVAPAVMADLFAAKQRGIAIASFVAVLFGGPMLAPIMGGFTVKNSSLGWRWTEYFCGIITALAVVLVAFVLPETHHPLILVKKAETLRRRTGNWGIFAPHEEISLSLREIAEKNITRPLYMLIVEPILLLVTIYNAFIYGMLYTFLTAIPFIFGGGYHFIPGVAELPYISMFIGIVLGIVVIIFFELQYGKVLDANDGKPVPEERLKPMMIGSFFFTVGLFWMGWTGQYAAQIHWIVPTISEAFVGFGLILVFLPCLTYIIECYLLLAASALAGNTFLRSSFGAAFPMFCRQMFEHIGVNWGMTIVGCVSLIMIPVPFMFYKYGKGFRQRSKFAFVL